MCKGSTITPVAFSTSGDNILGHRRHLDHAARDRHRVGAQGQWTREPNERPNEREASYPLAVRCDQVPYPTSWTPYSQVNAANEAF